MRAASTTSVLRDRLDDVLDRRRWIVLAILVAWLAAVLALTARAKPFWHDEVYTILESRIPLPTLRHAWLDGIDLAPPLTAILTRATYLVAGTGPIVTRLPATIGFLAAIVLTFMVVRRRTNTATGFASALFLSLTPALQYGVEARGYGLTIGLAALAVFGWSEAAAGRRRRRNLALLAVALAAGVWAHYYFVLMFVPIGIGELVRQLRARRLDVAAWLAFAAAVALILPLVPFTQVAARQRGIFWADPLDWQLLPTYRLLLGDYLLWLLAVIAPIAVIESVRRALARAWPRRLPAHELAAGLALLAVPAAAVVLGHVANAYSHRYVMFGTAALAIAIPIAVWMLMPANGVGELVFGGTIAVMFALFSIDFLKHPPKRADPLRENPALVDWFKGSEPIVLSGGVLFLEKWYALPESARTRVVYPADPDAQRRMNGNDTVDRGYLALARWTPVPIVPIDDWFRDHRHFYYYSLEPNWTVNAMRRRATVVERARERIGEARLYEVTALEPGKD